MRLDLVPVSDLDPANAFCVDRAGCALDHDVRPHSGARCAEFSDPEGTAWSLQQLPA